MHSFIQVRNAEQNDYKVGHNKMSDWTHEEYKSILTYKAISTTLRRPSPPRV